MKCKHCTLFQLPGFAGQGFCKFHWAGQLHGVPGQVPGFLQGEYEQALLAQRARELRGQPASPQRT